MADTPSILLIVYASIVGYVLGSIPAAYLISKAHGVNIFDVGSRQAGTTNVMRRVNRRAGVAVFIIDTAKGFASIYVARQVFGLDGAWVLLPSAATIVGHWNSPFTRFRGGDGVASLAGIAIGLFGALSLAPMIILTISLGVFRLRFAHPSLWAGLVGWLAFLVVLLRNSDPQSDDLLLFTGMSGLAIAILLHSVMFHLRHREYFVEEIPEQVAAEPDD